MILVVTFIRALKYFYLLGGGMPPPYGINAQDDSVILVVTFIRVLNCFYLVGGVMTPPYEVNNRDDGVFPRAMPATVISILKV